MAVSIENNELCTGCSACIYVCPVDAITIEQNAKGFYQPIVSKEKCIQCGICMNACHLYNKDDFFSANTTIYAAKNKLDEERQVSSSGGIYILLAKHILKDQGVVYGAAFDEKNVVKHIRATTIKEALQCCQSKYVQSNMSDVFPKVLQDVSEGKKVMFVGTPCQVSALRSAIKSRKLNEDTILFVDFICHGTPSPKVFSDYLLMIENKYGGKIKQFFFRDKDQGWRGNGYKALFYNRKAVINGFYLRGYNKLFALATNDACFQCRYSRPERVSDITLGDFWGIEHTPLSKFEDPLGISMLLVNSEKGRSWFKRVSEELDYEPAHIDYCINNTPLFHSPKKSKLCESFWDTYLHNDYLYTFEKYCKFTGSKGIYERFKWLVLYKLDLKDVILKIYSYKVKRNQLRG